ncbi:MAG: hypothetical protein HOO98_10445 [Nitrospira sp.]|nr:hypothetical protein [Nitrospira sp.]
MALGLSLTEDAWATTYNVIDLGFNVYLTSSNNHGQVVGNWDNGLSPMQLQRKGFTYSNHTDDIP